MKSRVVVIGGNGQLGTDLAIEWKSKGYDVEILTHHDIAVETIDSVRSVLKNFKSGIFLNTAAFHNVPQCEENPAKAFAVNAIGALNVSRVAEEIGATSVYFSTDYVFDGKKSTPYTEQDVANPLNVYAVSKLAGEYQTFNNCPGSYVFRISGIYGRVPCRAKGDNFVSTMIRLAREKSEVRVVQDEILTPTPTTEIAATVRQIIERESPGLYHLTSEGECSWYEFARVIFDELKLSTPLRPASVKDFPSIVKRPYYSVLENASLKSRGIATLPHWRDSLVRFLSVNYG